MREIHFSLTVDDLLSAMAESAGQTAHFTRSLFYFIVEWLFLLFLMVVLIFILQRNFFDSIENISILLGCWLVLAPLLLLFKQAITWFKMRKMRQRVGADPRIGVPQIYIWDEKSLSIRNGNVKGSYPWRLFYGYREFPDFIAIYMSATKFHIVPKRFLTDAQLHDLKQIAVNEIAASA